MKVGNKLISACVLARCGPGKFADVAKAAEKIEGVKTVFSTLGRWDVAADVEAADIKALSSIALKINGLPGVLCTETLVEVTI